MQHSSLGIATLLSLLLLLQTSCGAQESPPLTPSKPGIRKQKPLWPSHTPDSVEATTDWFEKAQGRIQIKPQDERSSIQSVKAEVLYSSDWLEAVFSASKQTNGDKLLSSHFELSLPGGKTLFLKGSTSPVGNQVEGQLRWTW